MIGIIGAMQSEINGLKDAIRDLRTERYGGFEFAIGHIGNHEVAVVRAGVGKVNAAVCAQTLILRYQPEIIINSGVAGSLSPKLNILDVAVATDAVQHDYDTTALGEPLGALTLGDDLVRALPCDAAWRERLLRAAEIVGVRAIPARIASGDRFVTSKEEKKRIVDNFQADACEMEGAAIVQTCYLSGVPCAVLRAISDSTDDCHHMEYTTFLPKAVEQLNAILFQLLSE